MGVLKTAQTVNVRPFNFTKCGGGRAAAGLSGFAGFAVGGRRGAMWRLVWFEFFVLVKKFSRFISCRPKGKTQQLPNAVEW